MIKYDRYPVFDGLSMIDAGNNSYLSYLFFNYKWFMKMNESMILVFYS